MKKINNSFKSKIQKPKNVSFYQEYPSFSLKNLAVKDEMFSNRVLTDLELYKFILGLSYLSQMTWKEIQAANKYYRFHEVVPSTTQYTKIINKLSFLSDEDKVNISIYQLKPISSKKKFRIFGYFNNKCIFEIVWFDPDHEIYGS